MAEAFLQVLLDNLTCFIQGELGLILGFKEEFEKLKSTFTTIQAVLEDAQKKQLKDKAIENWLQKLNSAAYEADDILDECKTEALIRQKKKYGCYHPNVIAFRHKVGKRMKNIMEKLDDIAAERIKFHLDERTIERQVATRQTGFVLNEPQVYGRDKEKDEIVKILINNVSDAQTLSVLPILGMGGLGKTTLAQMVFNDQRVIEHFHPKIWICVSEDFNEKRLIKEIVESIEEKSLGDMDLAPLQKKLQDLLNGKKYLLVLDDVWNEDQDKWAKLRQVLKVGASGAFVLTTTRLEKVGSIMGTLQPYELSNLSQEDCWLLFMQRAFGHQEEINLNLVAIGKEIVKKCGGVPLAAKTLGGILRFKREERQWEHVRDSEIWKLPQEESSILPALRLSYHHLPLDLRQCFAYCAVLPKDTEMEKENLISLWMAHGFLLSKGNLELEDVGNEVWNELYLRSFFQEIEVKSGKTYFKMHDLIHDLATSLFTASASSNHIREINVKGYPHMMSIGFAKVVSSYSRSHLQKFVSLRVLNLTYIGPKQLPSSIGDLVHLRYLNLSSNDRISSLPKQLCKLQNLQTLDLHDCWSLSCFPKETSKLGSLRNLLLDDHNELNSMPPRIGSLTCLKTLGCFVVGRKKSSQLGELRNLNLYGSIEITHLERVKNDMDAKEANLSAKENLHSLSMRWDGDERPQGYESEEVEVLEALKPHSNLTCLTISGFRGISLPDWMNHSVLKNVVSIEIRDCKNCSCLPPFGELPCLESLELWSGSAELEYVDSGFPTRRRFPSLRKLIISDFDNLKGLLKQEGEEQFPVLEEMEIRWCPIFVIPTLSSVKKLVVRGDKSDAIGFSSISNLRALTSLQISYNEEDTSLPEEMFTCLANLKYLNISKFKNLKELPTSLASLNALKHLDIIRCDALESLPEEGVRGLTSLTQLSIVHCEMLQCLPEGLQHLTALTNLSVMGCSTLAKRCEKGIGEDWYKIAHIPHVFIS
ncbi:putative disease resistance protein RGA1 isoform X2 [Solanum stenotomum]|uniref:putative disease resistance protein RGA1 isoform X2 n=1 Tax=Solanum stenotomum TaxID=172797 RepID=UPI0020D091D0|nr:putative disease resistance protein RGA1 isoform X2 [Solanum stenotomum]